MMRRRCHFGCSWKPRLQSLAAMEAQRGVPETPLPLSAVRGGGVVTKGTPMPYHPENR